MPQVRLNRAKIKKIIPFRRTLLLDRAEVDTDSRKAIGFFTVTERSCESYGPETLVFDGPDRLKVLFQTLALLALMTFDNADGLDFDGHTSTVNWRDQVKIGEEVRAEVQIKTYGPTIMKVIGDGTLYVGDRIVCNPWDLMLWLTKSKKY